MGSPEKPIDVEMGDMETDRLNPAVDVKGDPKEKSEDRFTGLKKDELLEISGQKNWVVARWVLFIIFWLAWIGMLVGAIIIVVKAPRCKPEPTPPWFQDTTVYEADVTKFAGDFNGTAKHLDYIRYLKSKTVIVVNAEDSADKAKVRNNDEAGFKKLVADASSDDKDKDLKIVVDLAVDSLGTSSAQFLASSNSSCAGASPTGTFCTLFQWKQNGSLAAEENWVYHPGRGENYKATADGNSAYLDFGNQQAIDYVKDVVKKWIAYGADGFQLRDFAMIGTTKAHRMSLVKELFDTFNKTQSQAENKKVIGLFLLSSDAATQSMLFPGNQTDSDKAAVVINSGLYGLNSSSLIEDAINKWRNATEPFTSAYAFNTMDKDLLAKANSQLAAGYSLLTYALAGVPYVRSGDEGLLSNDNFTWELNEELKIQIPKNASTNNIKVIQNIADLRVNQYRAMKSLRWDHNEDSIFYFPGTNSSDILAFARRWDTKPIALTLFNPTGRQIYVKVNEQPLPNKFGSGEVLGYTGSSMAEGAKVDLTGAIKMDAGSTLIMRVDLAK